MLRITPKEQDAKLTLALEGKLSGPWVSELALAWSEWQGRFPATDTVIDLPTRPEQALLYRLNGDDNPLHSNPALAAKANHR